MASSPSRPPAGRVTPSPTDTRSGEVAITGLGAVTPAGAGAKALWSYLCSGESAPATIDGLAERGLAVTMAAMVPDDGNGIGARSLLSGKAARRADRFTQLAAVAALEALNQAGLGPDAVASLEVGRCGPDAARSAVIVGTGIGGLCTTIEEGKKYVSGRPTNPLVIPMLMPNAAAANLAMQIGWTGPNFTIATACASGAHAIGEGLRLIQHGEADVVLVGGAEAAVHEFAIKAFSDLTALSTRNDEPSRASRPFDRDRDGFVMGEGAAFCVLERVARAEGRGAQVLARVLGYGRNTDAHHLVMPEPEGAGASSCIEAALRDADLQPESVGSISAHGTSTTYNDLAEARAVRTVFGDRAPPVTATKGALGHLIGAAGAVQAVVAALSLAEGAIPPTANFENPDPDIDLDIVTGAPRDISPAPILSSSFAFGGHNACLVIGPAEQTAQRRRRR